MKIKYLTAISSFFVALSFIAEARNIMHLVSRHKTSFTESALESRVDFGDLKIGAMRPHIYVNRIAKKHLPLRLADNSLGFELTPNLEESLRGGGKFQFVIKQTMFVMAKKPSMTAAILENDDGHRLLAGDDEIFYAGEIWLNEGLTKEVHFDNESIFYHSPAQRLPLATKIITTVLPNIKIVPHYVLEHLQSFPLAEFETKYRIENQETYEAVLKNLSGRTMTFHRKSGEPHRLKIIKYGVQPVWDVFYDTEDQAVFKNGAMLRRRTRYEDAEEKKLDYTVFQSKNVGMVVGDVFQRLEYRGKTREEVRVPKDQLTFLESYATDPAVLYACKVGKIDDPNKLRATLIAHSNRTYYTAYPAGSFPTQFRRFWKIGQIPAERLRRMFHIAVDRIEYYEVRENGELSEPKVFWELEIELSRVPWKIAPPDRAHYFLLEEISRHLKEQFNLKKSSASKFHVGMEAFGAEENQALQIY